MKVILREEVKNLGVAGSVVNVADGYARNYLLPKHLAVEANTANVKGLEHEKRKIAEYTRKVKNAAQTLAEKVTAQPLTITAKAGEEEKLFGSVTSMDIVEALKAQGFEIDRKKIVLDEPIKRLGTFTVGIKIHPEVTSDLTVHVVAAE